MTPERLTEVLAMLGADDELREELARAASTGIPPAAIRRITWHWARGLPIVLVGEHADAPDAHGITRRPRDWLERRP